MRCPPQGLRPSKKFSDFNGLDAMAVAAILKVCNPLELHAFSDGRSHAPSAGGVIPHPWTGTWVNPLELHAFSDGYALSGGS